MLPHGCNQGDLIISFWTYNGQWKAYEALKPNILPSPGQTSCSGQWWKTLSLSKAYDNVPKFSGRFSFFPMLFSKYGQNCPSHFPNYTVRKNYSITTSLFECYLTGDIHLHTPNSKDVCCHEWMSRVLDLCSPLSFITGPSISLPLRHPNNCPPTVQKLVEQLVLRNP